MSRQLTRLVVALLVGVSLALWIPDNTAKAAAPKRINGITISPAFQDITLNPEKASETFDVAVTNNTSEPQEFSLSVVDFGSLDESGGVLFIGETERKLNYRYGLSGWATLERDRITVEPKTTQKVPVSVINKESLSPGGHYGAVLLSPVASGDRPIKVQINQVMSSLLFVKKQGGEIYNFGMRSFEFDRNIFKAPSTVDFRFQNAGNVHVIPRGTVTITDPRGRVVKRGIINMDSAIILPETFRHVLTQLTSVSPAWMPGKYHASIVYRFDGEDKTELREVSFMYINIWYLILAILLVATVAAAVLHKKTRSIIFAGLRAPLRLVQKTVRNIKK
ncbi:MAG: hypothetical protein JWP13_807 [Candidatus Saccharibacteria bacterium]|nr:hypothetical protein [Candidatus Saccharibacteria bacterium]